jgi:hypothetical protein
MTADLVGLADHWDADAARMEADGWFTAAEATRQHATELRALAGTEVGGCEALSESDKDIALAQAVEFAEYVERQAKGEMVKAARKFLSLPYAQEIAKRLTPPGSGRGGVSA